MASAGATPSLGMARISTAPHMPQDTQLGEIRPYPLRSIWPHERFGLSAWMAKAENLQKLGQATGICELTLEGQPEFPVGTDHAIDIVARNAWGERVAIENQFNKSDADHLGRGLVYLTNSEQRVLFGLPRRSVIPTVRH